MTIIHDEPTLTEEEHAVEALYPGFHVFHSDGLHIYAVREFSAAEIADIAERTGLRVPSAVTLDAPTPLLIRYQIAVWLHEFPVGRAA